MSELSTNCLSPTLVEGMKGGSQSPGHPDGPHALQRPAQRTEPQRNDDFVYLPDETSLVDCSSLLQGEVGGRGPQETFHSVALLLTHHVAARLCQATGGLME